MRAIGFVLIEEGVPTTPDTQAMLNDGKKGTPDGVNSPAKGAESAGGAYPNGAGGRDAFPNITAPRMMAPKAAKRRTRTDRRMRE